MKPLIIYHAGCLDGAAAALAAWLKFGDEAEYRPASYGDPAPTDEEVRGRDVYVLDFSYSRKELVRMSAATMRYGEGKEPLGENLHVLDHHKSAAEDLEELGFCTFDTSKSGAMLAWEHFHSSTEGIRPDLRGEFLPELFAYVQDRDLWRWDLPHSREVSAALAASGALTNFRKLIPIYEKWANFQGYGGKIDLVVEGRAILRAERLQVERIAATAEEVEIYTRTYPPENGMGSYWDIRVRALATTSAVLQSEVGEALALESARRGRDAVGIVYYRDGVAGKWRVSLRSRDVEETDEQFKARAASEMQGSRGYTGPFERIKTSAPDVSAIAKSFGGGGHAKAAGFECDELPWVRR